MKKLPALHLPISAQVLIFALAAIVIAQLVTVGAISLAPVLPPPHYTTQEVAAALRDGRVNPHGRRPLTLRRVRTLPDDFLTEANTDAAARLAKALGVAADTVRVITRGAPTVVLATSNGAGAGPSAGGSGPPMGPPPSEPPPFDVPPRAGNGGPPGPPRTAPNRTANTFVEFAAARRLTDGQWLIVEPVPENEWLRRVWIWFAGGMLIIAPLAWLFARRMTRPIRRFAEAADQLGRDPGAPQVPLDGPAEIGLAARAFNTMRDRLQLYIRDRVSMMGAISHDLRTPLTRIRFKVEKLDPGVRESILSEVTQMESMISGVLNFMKDADTGAGREPLDLTSLVSCAVDDRAAAGDTVSMDEPAPVAVVEGDAIALRRLIDNLVDNAVKYGGAGQVTVTTTADAVVIAVADDGPGLTEAELEAVFQPFYRGRGAADRAQGVGLGLASARGIARAHGGDIRLHPGGRGLVAEVTLPRLPDIRPGRPGGA